MLTVVDNPDFYPFACAVTGRDDGPLIDTGASFQHNNAYPETRVYLKASYIEQIARDVLGMCSQAELDKLADQVNAYGEKVKELEEQVQAVNKLEEVLS